MDQAQDYFRDSQPDLKEERKMLLETWLDIELAYSRSCGSSADTEDSLSQIKAKLPIKVKKRR